VFQQLYDTDPVISNSASQNPNIQERERAVLKLEEALLKPLFTKLKSPSHGVKFSIPTRTALYLLFSSRKQYWPRIEMFPDWEICNSLLVSLRFLFSDSSFNRSVSDQLRVFQLWAESQGIAAQMTVKESDDGIDCKFRFSRPCGDWVTVLLQMIVDQRDAIPVENIALRP
jgi:hypothetical protein